MPHFKKVIYSLILFNILIGASSCTKENKNYRGEKYTQEEKVFLEYVLKSDLLEKSYKTPTVHSDINNNVKVLNIYDSLMSFENIGVSRENVKSIIHSEDEDLGKFKIELQQKRIEDYFNLKNEINIVYSDTSIVSFDNSFYKLSRVSFNSNYSEALIAIELVCFDCGGLVLYKFKRLSNGNWKMESLINIWIS